MGTKLKLDQSPYFDDYKESDKYYQILFRPGRAVQARELTQLQTILQKQIERLGKHIFKNGSNVLPGTENAVRYTPGITFIKLPITDVVPAYSPATFSESDIRTAIETIWVGATIETSAPTSPNDRTGIKGKIIGYRGPDNINGGEVRFFVNMLSASNNGEYSKFESGDTVTIVDGDYAGRTATIPSISAVSDQLKVGTVSSVTVEEGVYFYSGYFVYVDKQTLFLAPIDPTGVYDSDSSAMQSRWSELPTASVGFTVTEQVKTFQDDYNLLDNALNTPNYSAPGADRLHISLDLTQTSYNPTEPRPDNFIALLDVSNGRIYSILSSPEYGPLMDTIARRTYDESGDYVTENMSVQITDFLREDGVKSNGAHSIKEFQFLTKAQAQECALKVFGFTVSSGASAIEHTDGYWYPGSSFDGKNDKTSFKQLCDSLLTARVDPGKAYVKGYEITKLSKTNVDIPKSRTQRFCENTTIPTPLGNYFQVTDLSGNTIFTKFISVDLYNVRRTGTQGTAQTSGGVTVYPYTYPSSLSGVSSGNKIGTATLIKIEADPAEGDGFYKAYITDIKMIEPNNLSSIKLIHAPSEGLYAHTTLSTYPLTGAISTPTPVPTASASGFTVDGTAATGWYSVPGEILKANDYVYVEGTQELYKITESPSSNASIKLALESGATGTVSPFTNSVFYGTYTTLNASENESGLIYPLSDHYISTVRTKNSTTGDIDTTNTKLSYTIEQVFNNSGDGLQPTTSGSGSASTKISKITLDISTTDNEFDPNIYRYKVVRKNGTTKVSLSVVPCAIDAKQSAISENTVGVYLQSGTTTSGDIKLQTIYFYFNESDAAIANTYSIIIPVIKKNQKEKTKTLKYGSFKDTTVDGISKKIYTHSANSASFTPTDGNEGLGVKVVDAANNSEIYLGNSTDQICDVYRITRIIASKDGNTIPSRYETLNAGDVDVTALYLFDNGQTDYEYGYPKVYLRPTYQKPAGKVRVEFDYFEHSGTGDYFSVDSYTHSAGVLYDEIPSFKSSSGYSYPLADCLDFRKKITDTSSGTPPVDYLTCDYFVYNGRNDKIVLNSKTKQFELLKGTPGVEPEFPEDDEQSMTLVELYQNPYGVGKDSCRMKLRDNRRYTMRDIGKLEKRIENLEYYTTLSLLERETSNMTITDANGNNRFKNGFLVDSFKSFESSDTESFDFSCSIDTSVENVARPLSAFSQFNLVEDLSNAGFSDVAQSLRNPSGGHTNYTKAGDLFMLPYTRSEFISQGIATKVINVNPFAVFTYVGNISLTPWSDTWREERNLDPITIYDDDAYQQARNLVSGQIDYAKTINAVSSIKEGKIRRTGRWKLLKAGHLLLSRLSPRERQEVLRTKKYRVPDTGEYTNAGEYVDIDTKGGIVRQAETRQTTTITSQRIRIGLATELQKTGVQTTRALTRSDTTQIEYMRTRDILVTGQSFKPNANLYPYFDDIPVAPFCRPIDPVDAQNWTNYTLVDITNTSECPVGILHVESSSRYFKLLSSTATFPVSPTGTRGTPGQVRVGCEVLYISGTGGERRFDIVEVLKNSYGNYTIIKVKEKPAEGVLTTDLRTIGDTTSGFVGKISKYSFGDQLKASGNGSVSCIFRIPSGGEKINYGPTGPSIMQEGHRFKTGQAKFVLSTSSASSKPGSGISRASADFLSQGTLHTQQETITQTQQFVVTSNLVDQSSTSTQERDVYDFLPPEIYDPIAQTFTIKETGGCFITDVEVFFAKKPAQNNVDVKLELRTVSLDGVPEFSIVGGTLGTVIKHAHEVVVNEVKIQDPTGATTNNTLEVQVDSSVAADVFGGVYNAALGKVQWNSTSSVKSDSIKKNTGSIITANTPFVSSDMSADMVPTRFTFKSPIYLEEGKTYAFVLISDSDDYETWIAQRGNYYPIDQNVEYGYYKTLNETNVRIGTTESIDNQSLYTDGNFFKSNNGLAWEMIGSVSAKFNIGKAVFNARSGTNLNVGEVVFVNESIGWTDVPSNGLEIRPGSNKIRVLCINHGVSVDDRVVFTFDMATDSSGKIRGFLKTDLQNPNGLRVCHAETDYFTVEVEGSTASADLAREEYRLGAHVTNSNNQIVPTVHMRISKKFEGLLFNPNVFCPKGTSIEWTIQTRPTAGVNEYTSNGTLVKRSSNSKLSPISVVPGTSIDFDAPMLLAAPERELVPTTTGLTHEDNRKKIREARSVLIKGRLISDNSNISPVLDSSRMVATTVTNRLDNPRGVASTAIGNVVNNPDFDTLTIFNNSVIPSDIVISSSGTKTSLPRQPQPTDSTALVSKLKFSKATSTLEGTFSQQSVNSKTIIGTGSSLVGAVRPGDIVFDISNPDPDNRRTVVRVVNGTKMILSSPFNPPLAAGARLSLADEYMVISTQDSVVAAHLSQMDVGKYATLEFYTGSGSPITYTKVTSSSDAATFAKMFTNKLITGVEYTPDESVKCKITIQHFNTSATDTVDSTNYVTITQLDRYVDEIASEGGTFGSRYICKKLNLDRPSSALKITFDAIRDEYSDLELYYRIEGAAGDLRIYDKNWIKAPYNIEVDGILTIKSPEPSDSVFKTYESTLNGLPQFNAVQAKVVFRGGNPAKPPKIKNFTLIALDE